MSYDGFMVLDIFESTHVFLNKQMEITNARI